MTRRNAPERVTEAALDEAAAVFAEVRPRLFGIAYRMLGSAVDAEDLLQEVWLRWQTCDRSSVTNPGAYLATATTRLAINATKSAYARHETYPGPWLPEPVDTSADPYLGAERAAALELAVLLLLEKLTPTERAAYVLREAFAYPYHQIAEIVQTSEVTARQHVSRARKHLATNRRAPVDESDQQRLLTAFIAAAQDGDLSALEQLLADDVTSYADSGGTARASRVPLHGATTVAKVIRAFAAGYWTGVSTTPVLINAQPGALLLRDGTPFGILTITASAEGIDQVLWMVNPTKLAAALSPASGLEV
jgi:RNA polymerase sigma factor (sigma-70 family)